MDVQAQSVKEDSREGKMQQIELQNAEDAIEMQLP
jgi:hypothetical protein